jgi:hypothetical protein
MDFPADGEVSFWHTGETEYSYDFLEFRMDGLLLLSASGYWAWQFDSFPVTAGYHAFEWRYSKDGSVSDGADTVWLDDIQMPGANP